MIELRFSFEIHLWYIERSGVQRKLQGDIELVVLFPKQQYELDGFLIRRL